MSFYSHSSKRIKGSVKRIRSVYGNISLLKKVNRTGYTDGNM